MDFEEHLTGDSHVVVAFAGGPQNVYQFGATLQRLKLSYVLMRDTTQHYHSEGVIGIGDQQNVVRYLRGKFRTKLTTYIGTSSGAYAALLYGQLAPADEVIAIAPLTGRTTADWPPEVHHRIYDPAHPDLDLKPYYQSGPISRVRAFVSDGDGCDLDRQMATRIGIRDITLVPGYAHKDLARGMRDIGMLKELLVA